MLALVHGAIVGLVLVRVVVVVRVRVRMRMRVLVLDTVVLRTELLCCDGKVHRHSLRVDFLVEVLEEHPLGCFG